MGDIVIIDVVVVVVGESAQNWKTGFVRPSPSPTQKPHFLDGYVMHPLDVIIVTKKTLRCSVGKKIGKC